MGGEAGRTWPDVRDGPAPLIQVDNWPKRMLVGVAVAYIALVVLVPFFNVFIQVGCRDTACPQQAPEAPASTGCLNLISEFSIEHSTHAMPAWDK